ncbi:Hypothetical predicted protein [Mytilus galloprovincialis]|uniref:Uncharacterized protein n=1 Tax=Mytilus galloprovincialis TaxID=29158 RepID=A0A8B6H844_MYTGA|nr:Hypothetical predicted protein [Mytilus galloprovincialis]
MLTFYWTLQALCIALLWNGITSKEPQETSQLLPQNTSSLVNKVHVIPGISDYETVYIESSLRPIKTKLPPREVYTYKKGDFDAIKTALKNMEKEFSELEASNQPAEIIWTKFKTKLINLMEKHIPKKTIRGNKTKKPWIDIQVKAGLREKQII